VTPDAVQLRVHTPLGFEVAVTRERWLLITGVKHPVMAGRESEVQSTLAEPDQVRVSRREPNVLLFYRAERPGRWTCAVVRRSGAEALLVTAYPTDAVKEGEQTWAK
jgi:hypothetical protein